MLVRNASRAQSHRLIQMDDAASLFPRVAGTGPSSSRPHRMVDVGPAWADRLRHGNDLRRFAEPVRQFSGDVTFAMPPTSRPSRGPFGRTPLGGTTMIVTLQINNSARPAGHFLTWAPSPCRIRMTNRRVRRFDRHSDDRQRVAASGGAVAFRSGATGAFVNSLTVPPP